MFLHPAHTYITTLDGFELPSLLFTPEEKTTKVAIFLHGNGTTSVFSSVEKMGVYSKMLHEKGIAFFAFNNRGADLVKQFSGINEDGTKWIKTRGTAYERIKECIFDIDGAISFLKEQGFEEFYLIGESTGANKIVVYDFYKKENSISKYILVAGGDDLGYYYSMLGASLFQELLIESKKKISENQGEELIPYEKVRAIISWQSYLDVCDPDGDYNVFPYLEYFTPLKLSTKQTLFNKFSNIEKEMLIIYGSEDEFSWPDKKAIKDLLLDKALSKDKVKVVIIPNADHSFSGKREELVSAIVKWL